MGTRGAYAPLVSMLKEALLQGMLTIFEDLLAVNRTSFLVSIVGIK